MNSKKIVAANFIKTTNRYISCDCTDVFKKWESVFVRKVNIETNKIEVFL